MQNSWSATFFVFFYQRSWFATNIFCLENLVRDLLREFILQNTRSWSATEKVLNMDLDPHTKSDWTSGPPFKSFPNQLGVPNLNPNQIQQAQSFQQQSQGAQADYLQYQAIIQQQALLIKNQQASLMDQQAQLFENQTCYIDPYIDPTCIAMNPANTNMNANFSQSYNECNVS